MPACTYLSDREALLESGDSDIDELLTAANKINGNRWRIRWRLVRPRKRWFRAQAPDLRFYTLYWFIAGIEYQVINLHTPQGGSVFYGSAQSKSDICNYLMGYLNGHQSAALTEER